MLEKWTCEHGAVEVKGDKPTCKKCQAETKSIDVKIHDEWALRMGGCHNKRRSRNNHE